MFIMVPQTHISSLIDFIAAEKSPSDGGFPVYKKGISRGVSLISSLGGSFKILDSDYA